jgi:hypothetical protein
MLAFCTLGWASEPVTVAASPPSITLLSKHKISLVCAAGDGELQQHVWCEVMALAAASLTVELAPAAPSAEGAATSRTAAQQPAGGKATKAPAQNPSQGTAPASYTEAAAAADSRRRRFSGFMAWVRQLLAAAAAGVTTPLAAETLQLQVRPILSFCAALYPQPMSCTCCCN